MKSVHLGGKETEVVEYLDRCGRSKKNPWGLDLRRSAILPFVSTGTYELPLVSCAHDTTVRNGNAMVRFWYCSLFFRPEWGEGGKEGTI